MLFQCDSNLCCFAISRSYFSIVKVDCFCDTFPSAEFLQSEDWFDQFSAEACRVVALFKGLDHFFVGRLRKVWLLIRLIVGQGQGQVRVPVQPSGGLN